MTGFEVNLGAASARQTRSKLVVAHMLQSLQNCAFLFVSDVSASDIGFKAVDVEVEGDALAAWQHLSSLRQARRTGLS